MEHVLAVSPCRPPGLLSATCCNIMVNVVTPARSAIGIPIAQEGKGAGSVRPSRGQGQAKRFVHSCKVRDASEPVALDDTSYPGHFPWRLGPAPGAGSSA